MSSDIKAACFSAVVALKVVQQAIPLESLEHAAGLVVIEVALFVSDHFGDDITGFAGDFHSEFTEVGVADDEAVSTADASVGGGEVNAWVLAIFVHEHAGCAGGIVDMFDKQACASGEGMLGAVGEVPAFYPWEGFSEDNGLAIG
jgi:hypothetical protein